MKKLLVVSTLALVAVAAHSQTIERIKMTDNDLSCQLMFNEIGQMDAIMAKSSTSAAAPVTNSGVGAQVAGNVAQAALAVATSPGPLSGLGGLGGSLGGMFGGFAQQLAQGAASQQAAQQAAAQQQAAAAQQSQAMQAQQAQGRKEHLTGLFLSKGCKMSDIQK